MPHPKKLSANTLDRIRRFEAPLVRESTWGFLEKAKKILDELRPVLEKFNHRTRLFDLPDELWTKIKIEFYKIASDAVFKSQVELGSNGTSSSRRAN